MKQTTKDNFVHIILSAILAITLVIWIFSYARAKECEESGGTYVSTYGGYKCVQL